VNEILILKEKLEQQEARELQTMRDLENERHRMKCIEDDNFKLMIDKKDIQEQNNELRNQNDQLIATVQIYEDKQNE